MHRKLKLLFINHATGWGGASINMVNIIEGLDKTKYEAKVLLIRDSNVGAILKCKGIEYVVASSWFYKKHYQYFSHGSGGHKWYHFLTLGIVTFSWLLSRFYFSAQVLKNLDCDLIHINSSALTDWLPVSRKKAMTVIHIQEALAEGYLGLRKAFFRWYIKKYAHHVIAISKDNARRLNLPDMTTIAYNFTDITPDDDKWHQVVKNHVLYVGGAQKIKGFFTLIKALDYLDDGILVCFCGHYPDKVKKRLLTYVLYFRQNKRLFNASLIMNNHKNAHVIGMVRDITPLIEKTTSLISPFSREHFSRPVIEAFANKKPVIVTNVEGMEEIVDNMVNGLIVEKDDPRALAEAINYMCAHPDVAKEMGERGYTKAKTIFSPKNIKTIEKVYDTLAKQEQLAKY
jgi:glycosyltransferase involved in cell wall biosynthesis